MSKAKIIQTNFTGGELSPLMFGRSDTVKYQNGAAKLDNMLVRPQGGLWKRGGFRFAGEVKTSSKLTILQDFQYSDIQAYIVEFGDYYVRIWFDGGFVETAPASGVPLEVTTLYAEADLARLTFTQSNDVLYIFHPALPTKKLRRLGANSWDIIDCDFQDGPYITQTSTAITLRVTDYTSFAKAVATTPIFTGVSVSRLVSAISQTFEITTTVNHGWTSGTVVNVSNLTYTAYSNYRGVTTPYGPIPITGQFIITVTAVNKFTLNGFVPVGSFVPYTFSFGSALLQTIGTAKNFEYKQENQWKLAEILTITDTTHADVKVYGSIKQDVPKEAEIKYYGSNNSMSSSLTGVFSFDDVGKYIKTSAGTWHQITSFVNDVSVYVTVVIPLISYDPAVTYVTVSTPVITGKVTADANAFVSTDEGRHIRFNFGGKRPWGIITQYVSATVVIVSFKAEVPVDPSNIAKLYNEGGTNLYQLGSWSKTTGYPRTGVFHEQRLWTGGTTTEPLNLWGSQPGDFENNAPTEYDSVVTDSSAINYTLVSKKANPIIWLESGTVLLVGSQGDAWQVKGASSVNQPITPTNINVTPQANTGSLVGCKPVRIGSVVMFVQKSGRKMIEMAYDFNQDSFQARDLNIVSDHIFRKGIKAKVLAYQQEPFNIVWVVLQDGTLAAMTYDKDQQVMAWHPHYLGGGGLVESVAVVPSIAQTEDTLYAIVKRTINGATKRYIEYLTPDFYPANELDKTNMFLVDCGITYNGAPATVFNVNHLTNQIVSVVADGVYLGEKVLSGTTLTLTTAASVVHVGYKYRSLVRVLPLEGGSPNGGTAQGKIKRVGTTMVRTYNTLDSFTYGKQLEHLDKKVIVDGNGTPSNKFVSDDLIVNVPMSYEYTGMFYLVQDLPYPFVVLAIAPNVEVTQ